MIRVVREGGRSPNSAWTKRARAKTLAAISQGAAHVIDESTYGHAQVRMALEDLFRRKCAYCESFTTATSPWDVEHFRPKKAVSAATAHPGYFWLAYTWENLYLSCQFCNQRRRDQPTTEEPTLGPAKGKLDQFPLSDESTRAMKPGDNLAAEARLLLDPCADDPSLHLTFGLKGRAKPVVGSAMGATTIEVCNLNRKRLREQRETLVQLVLEQVETFKGDRPLATVLDGLRDTLGAPKQHYSAVVQAVCDQPAAFGLS